MYVSFSCALSMKKDNFLHREPVFISPPAASPCLDGRGLDARWMDVKMECPTCRRALPPM